MPMTGRKLRSGSGAGQRGGGTKWWYDDLEGDEKSGSVGSMMGLLCDACEGVNW